MSRQETAYRGSWAKTRKKVLDRDGWQCAWCERDLRQQGVKATVDHVVSLKQGRADGWSEEQLKSSENLVAACGSCNSSRAERPGPPKRGREAASSSRMLTATSVMLGPDTAKNQKWKMQPTR